MKKQKLRYLVVMLGLVVTPGLTLLIMSKDDNITLFDITRSLDDDKLNYDLNLDENGKLNTADPIHPYWVRNTEGGITKELNSMQRNFAYGLKYLKKSEDAYVFQFVSYKKRTFILKKNKVGDYKVFTKVGDKYVIVKNLYLEVTKNGTIFDLPKLAFVEINYSHISSGKTDTERINLSNE